VYIVGGGMRRRVSSPRMPAPDSFGPLVSPNSAFGSLDRAAESLQHLASMLNASTKETPNITPRFVWSGMPSDRSQSGRSRQLRTPQWGKSAEDCGAPSSHDVNGDAGDCRSAQRRLFGCEPNQNKLVLTRPSTASTRPSTAASARPRFAVFASLENEDAHMTSEQPPYNRTEKPPARSLGLEMRKGKRDVQASVSQPSLEDIYKHDPNTAFGKCNSLRKSSSCGSSSASQVALRSASNLIAGDIGLKRGEANTIADLDDQLVGYVDYAVHKAACDVACDDSPTAVQSVCSTYRRDSLESPTSILGGGAAAVVRKLREQEAAPASINAGQPCTGDTGWDDQLMNDEIEGLRSRFRREQAQVARLQERLHEKESQAAELTAQAERREAALQQRVAELERVVDERELAYLSISSKTAATEERSQTREKALQKSVVGKDKALRCAEDLFAESRCRLEGIEKQQLAHDDSSAQLMEVQSYKKKTEEEMELLSNELEKQHEKELVRVRAEFCLANVVAQKDATIKHQEESIAVLRYQLEHCQTTVARTDASEELWKCKAALRVAETRLEKELIEYNRLVTSLGEASSCQVLQQHVDIAGSEVLGMGRYGYILTCQRKDTGQRMVVKLQSQRLAAVVAREWSHGVALRKHEGVVKHEEVLMHRDEGKEIEAILKAAFDKGTLQGRMPDFFPDCYLCLLLEYMDSGSVQNLLDGNQLTSDGVLAISQQVSSIVADLHRQNCAHNDIKPDNILLRRVPGKSHLAVKLADFGMAKYSESSLEKKRDCDLFAYTVYCMALGRSFEKCISSQDEQGSMVENLQADSPALAKVVDGLWKGELSIQNVQEMKFLQGHELLVDHAFLPRRKDKQ